MVPDHRERCTVLVIDDEPDMRKFLCILLSQGGLETVEATDGQDGLQMVKQRHPHVILLDIRMPRLDGIGFLRGIQQLGLTVPVIVLTAFGTIDAAVEAIKAGAYDYLTKPFLNEDLLLRVRRAAEMSRLTQENSLLRARLDQHGGLREQMGPSGRVGRLIAEVDLVAPTDFTVILSGETGSGKELVARAIHQHSRRNKAPFVPVDCGAIQASLIESDLFGHEKGASREPTAPGPASSRRRLAALVPRRGAEHALGRADTLPARLAGAVDLHVGGNRSIHIDLRIVAASNLDLGGPR